MRIESKSVTPVAAPSTHEARSAKPDKAPASAPAASVVQLSTAATAATSGDTATHGLTQRLAVIKTQLSTGQYAVDLDRLANRIVDDESLRGKSS